MTHPDNMTAVQRGISQTESLLRECFRMAERLVMASGADSFESREAREKSQALIPIVAMDIKQSVWQFINIDEAPQHHVDRAKNSGDQIIAALKQRNDEAEKGG